MFGRKQRLRKDIAARVVAVVERMMQSRGIKNPVDLKVSLAEDGLGFDSMARLVRSGCETSESTAQLCTIPSIWHSTRPDEPSGVPSSK